MSTNLEVAKTIHQQLGPMAFAMMGAKDFVGDVSSLKFKIGRNAKSVTHIHIALEPSDTYTVTFYRYRKLEMKPVAVVSDVYVDSLKSTITANTGLYLKL